MEETKEREVTSTNKIPYINYYSFYKLESYISFYGLYSGIQLKKIIKILIRIYSWKIFSKFGFNMNFSKNYSRRQFTYPLWGPISWLEKKEGASENLYCDFLSCKLQVPWILLTERPLEGTQNICSGDELFCFMSRWWSIKFTSTGK